MALVTWNPTMPWRPFQQPWRPFEGLESLRAEMEHFRQIVESRAETLSFVDYCYWRKALEDILENGQRRIYERYESVT
jgi:hypothetical protein